MAASVNNGNLSKGEEQNLVVALRTRPLNEEETSQGATTICHTVDNKMVVLLDPQEDPDDILRANRTREKQFVFDHALDGMASQEDVYQKTSRFVIPTVVNGFNATVFAYGATGAGKTYTMLGTDNEPGIMARALNDLFHEIESSKEDYTYKVSMKYLEIYNEMIRDLLNPETGFLELREDSKGVQVPGLQEIGAHTSSDVMDMLVKGNKERTQEPTAANKTSSRSHAILQITVRQRPRVHGPVHEVRTGKLFLIDLAGSERAAATHNRGKRMVEGAHINRSLLALGNCINALSDKNGAKYVNFRDSKLTRLLKDSLGGNCKTVMIAHVSPASMHFEETRNTLLYAERAKHIKTKVRKNVMDVQYHIHQYTNIITELREEVKRLRDKLDQQALYNKNASAIQAIQTEVMEAAQRDDEFDLNRLKDQLFTVFQDQIELRRSLMELDNTTMENRLETGRNHLLIKKWEQERALIKRRKEKERETADPEGPSEGEKTEDENIKDAKKEKSTKEKGEEEGASEEVRVARDEMVALQLERERTDRQRANVTKELQMTREKAIQIEEVLMKKAGNAEQREILNLMVKANELEIENMEMQSTCLLRNFEMRRKDMLMTKYKQHITLCDEIIQQQRSLMDDYQVTVPKDLDELYELYKQQQEDVEEEEEDSTGLGQANYTPNELLNTNKMIGSMTSLNRRMLESDSMSDMDRLGAVDEEGPEMAPPPTSRVLAPSTKRQFYKGGVRPAGDDDKIFSRSARAEEIRDAQVASVASLASHPEAPTLPLQRQRSIITLSSQSTTPPPTSTVDVRGRQSERPVQIRREEIASKTRNIAALAAARRTKAQLDAYNNERLASFASFQGRKEKPTGTAAIDDRDARAPLTASRLAQHDSRYGGGSTITLQHLIDDDYDLGEPAPAALPTTVTSRPAGRARYGRSTANPRSQAGTKKKAATVSTKRARSQDIAPSLSKTTPARRAMEGGAAAGRRPRVTPAATKTSTKTRQPLTHHDDIREFESLATPTTSVHQTNTEKGRGLTVQRRVRGAGHASDTLSVSGTPRQPKTKRPPPTIPAAYRKTDMAIAGFGIKK